MAPRGSTDRSFLWPLEVPDRIRFWPLEVPDEFSALSSHSFYVDELRADHQRGEGVPRAAQRCGGAAARHRRGLRRSAGPSFRVCRCAGNIRAASVVARDFSRSVVSSTFGGCGLKKHTDHLGKKNTQITNSVFEPACMMVRGAVRARS